MAIAFFYTDKPPTYVALQKKGLAFITLMYWGMLLYVIAALVWWFISLEQQNGQMTALRVAQLQLSAPTYHQELANILDLKRRKRVQYIGEGITFLVLILVGAVFVYRATRRQLKLNQLQQNFMMAVTHELKTPISIARLNMETLLRRQLSIAQQHQLLDHTLHETERLNDLCNNILLASNIEGGTYQMQWDAVDLSALAAEALARFQQRFPQRRFESQLPGPVMVEGEKILLNVLINNLLENALKYGGAAGKVWVSLAQRQHDALLQVADDGPGIDASEQRHIFKKFYRIGNEHTRQASGTGLGLYLCRKIALQHGGHISVATHMPCGAVFSVQLPLVG
jgi:two-component system, OmpR family, sensor histidine kinase CiaH